MNNLTLTDIVLKLKKKELSSLELTQSFLSRIEATEPKINAIITVTKEEALSQAKNADKLMEKGTWLPLLGVPIVVKDNYCTQGVLTTAASKVLSNFVPPYSATAFNKVQEAGTVLLGKANMDAWAHGSSTETSDYEATKNPWDLTKLPGGSSGGSAAAIAAGQAVAALGTETAGSIRQPAAWCGVVGLKPTYGRVSRYGIVAMASSTDSPGPITKTVRDAAYLLGIMAGNDPKDATTSPLSVPDYIADLNKDLSGTTVGVCEDYFEGVDDQVKEKILDALKIYEKLGAKIKKISLINPKYSIAVYTIIQRAEVSSNLARYDGIRYGKDRTEFGEEAKRRIMLGTYVLSAGYYDAYYKKASQVRTLIVEDFKKAFKEVDVIIAPTSPTTALPLGSSQDQSMFGETADVLVEPSSIAGLPGISIPVGLTDQGLPVGMQIIGPQFEESRILNVANMFEHETEFNKPKPNL